jgi:hypothetical protein
MTIRGVEVSVKKFNDEDYISLTDMLSAKDGKFFITDWLRNRNTLEYIGIWERIHNADFNYGEFATIRDQAGLNRFKVGVQEFAARTNAISLRAVAGRYGGTFAHKDIAFEFGMWISPEFKIYLVKEFQRLKENEQRQLQWTARRELTKLNYHIHTDAIKENLIVPTLTEKQRSFVYADEADVLNVALFGSTALQWRTANPGKKGNVRDHANIHQLLVLSNMESYNSIMIKNGIGQNERIQKLNDMARYQLPILVQSNATVLLDEDKKGAEVKEREACVK